METDGTGARRAASPLLAAALDYAARGWRVFPLHAPTPSGGCTCGQSSCSTGKHPRTKNGLKDASTSAGVVRGWWARWPGANVGIASGAQSGFIVLDVDVIHDGTASLVELQRKYGRLPETRSTITGSGGAHLLYQHPGGGRIVGNTVHLDGLPGLDIRGDGGYIVAPPSMHASGARYEWENDLPIAPLPGWLATLLAKPQKPVERPAKVRALAGDEEGEECAHWLDKALARAVKGNRNHTGFWLACQLRDAGVRQDRAEAVLADYAQDAPGAGYPLREAIASCISAYREPPREKAKSLTNLANPKRQKREDDTAQRTNNITDISQSTRLEPENATDAPPEEPRDEARPLIIAKDRQLRDMTEEAIAALEAANMPPALFRRNRALARVRPDEKGRPVVEEIGEPVLRARLTEIADFGKWVKNVGQSGGDGDGDDEKFIVRPMTPPSDLVQNILAQPDWTFPALLNIVESPVVRPDGSILTTPGYDAATQLYYAPAAGLRLPRVPMHPTQDEVRRALGYLDEVLGDFPYDGPASKAHTLALLLTSVVRPAIAGKTPMALITAPASGTGKGLLAGLVPAIATGREPSVMTAPTKEEEWAKKITSTLMTGPALILIDNIRGALSSGHLEAALTTTVWEDRALGTNTIVSLPQRAVWMAAGNNLQLGGDMPRRCYRIRLDAKMARPERRKGFKHPDVTTWAREHRGGLLAALLILARAWYADGCPDYDITPMGSFEEWARVVGSILAHAGVSGFLTNLEAMYEEADSGRPQWAAFFAAWWECYGSDPTTASKIANLISADAHHPLHGALPDDLAPYLTNGGALTKKLGNHLRHQVEVRYELDTGQEMFLTRVKKDRPTEATRWRIQVTPKTA